MKTKLHSLLLSITILLPLFYSSCYSQDFWEQLPFPDSVSMLCIHTNTSGNIFVGVGRNGEFGGLYRSTDSGQSWEMIYNSQNGVHHIEIDENDKIYIAKRGFVGLLCSEDNGETWDPIELPTNHNIVEILKVGIDTIYLSIWADFGSQVIRSPDDGLSWQEVFSNSNSGEYISDISINSAGYIWLSAQCYDYNQGGVYRSVDNGTNWEFIGLLNHQVLSIESSANNYTFSGDHYTMGNEEPGIYRMSDSDPEPELVLLAISVQDIIFDAEGIMYATANDNIVISYDNGENFEYINDTLSCCIRHLHIDQNNYLYGINSARLVRSINPLITANEELKTPSDNHNLIKVYPVPVKDNLYISFNKKSKKSYNIDVFNMTGQKLISLVNRQASGKIKLETSSLDIGVYVLRIMNEEEIYKSTIIIQ